MSLIRGTSLQGFADLVAEFGQDPRKILWAAGIDPAHAGDPDAFLSYRAVVDAIESGAIATGAADFGRRLAQRQGLDILGPVGVAARTAPTVGAALVAIGQYMSVYSPALQTTVEPAPGSDLARFTFGIVLERLPDHRQVVELALGVALRTFRLLIDPQYHPVTVHLPHAPVGPAADYADYFGCRARFEESFAGFSLRQSTLTQPLSSDSAVHAVVRRYLQTLAPTDSAELSQPVRQIIRRLLPTGELALDPIAAHFAMHPRTLQRRLAAEGTSFADLVDQVRRDVVGHYLRDTRMPLSQLAAIAGYREQSAMNRSCRRWFDVTPSAYRRATRAEPVTSARNG